MKGKRKLKQGKDQNCGWNEFTGIHVLLVLLF